MMNDVEVEVRPSLKDDPSTKKYSVSSIEDHDEFVESTSHLRSSITVEPIVMFYVIVLYLQMSVLSQYIYYRVGVDNNITHNGTLAYVCDRKDNVSSEMEKTNRLQDLMSTVMMYIALCSAFCTIITAPFYCVFSDRFGRRMMYFLPGTGSVLKSLFELLIIVYSWPVHYFILTEGLFGLFGGFNFAIGLSYTYIADISSSKTRTRRIAVLVSMMGCGALVVSLMTGYWITAQGYLIPFSFSACVSVLCLLYPLLFLQEPPRMHDQATARLPPLQQLRTLVTIYLGRPRHQTIMLVIILVMFNFYYVAEMSTFGIISTYLMSFPLCMTSVEMSYFSFTNMLVTNVGIVVAVFGLARCIPELILVMLCHLSSIAFSIQMAFATSPTFVYIAAASNMFSYSAFYFIRGFLSKQVGPFEQGALFGGLVLCETVGGAITKVVIVYFYKQTFHTLHGMVYLFITCFSVTAFFLTMTTVLIKRRFEHMKGFTKLN